MGIATVQGMTTEFQQLSPDDQKALFFIIRRILYPNTVDHEKLLEDLRENKFSTGPVCPHCSGTNVIRYGHAKGRQRYRCKNDKDYGKVFNDFAKSPVARTRYPEKWALFAPQG
jgi:transposase-like protein